MLSALAFGSGDGKYRIPPSLAAKYEYIGIGLFQACPSTRGICRAFVIFSWNGCKCPTVGPGGSYKTPTGGAEKKVNFFSAKFSITVKCWKKGATLTALEELTNASRHEVSVVEIVVSRKHGLLPSSHTMDWTLRDFSIEVAVEGLTHTITNSQNKETTKSIS